MESERVGDHHAALTRDLRLGLVGNASHLARHDPMRLPDALLRRADMPVRAVGSESERFKESSKLSSHSEGSPEYSSDEGWESFVRNFQQGFNGDETRAAGYSGRALEYSRAVSRSPPPFERDRVIQQRAGPSSSRYVQAVSRSPSPFERDRVIPRPSSSRYIRPARHAHGAQGIEEVSSSRLYHARDERRTRTTYRETPSASRSSPRETIVEIERPVRRPRLYNMDKELGLSPGWPSHERQALPSATLPHRRRPAIVCQTVSRDETSSEEAKKTSLVKAAMEPHTRGTQMGKAFRAYTPTSMLPESFFALDD